MWNLTARGPITTRFPSCIKPAKQLLASQVAPWSFSLVMLVGLALALGLNLGEEAAPVAWAKVWGGPTEGPTPVSLRVELVEPLPAHSHSHTGVELRVESDRHTPFTFPLRFDDQNAAHVRLAEPLEHPWIAITRGSQRLASGRIRLDRDRFWQTRRVRSSWLQGRSEGAWTIRAGCREGAFALGHAGRLGITVTDPGGQPVLAQLTIDFEGLDAAPLAPPIRVSTDARGRASIDVVPRDFSASVRVSAFHGDAPKASYFASIPISSSALVGSLQADKIVVESWLPVPRIYYALVNEQGLWASGGVARSCEGQTQCRVELSLEHVPATPAWLMLGSEASLDGSNVIGWPVLAPESTFVPETVVVRDQLLLDGRAEAEAQAAARRRARFQFALFGLAIAVVVLGTACVWPMLRSRKKVASLLARLPKADSHLVVERHSPSAALLVLLIGLGLFALLFWIRARILGP